MPQLDGLRGLAAVAVVAQHSLPYYWFGPFQPGKIAVYLFFVLSGFLITGILVDARRRAAGAGVGRGRVLASFYARRAVRIFPLYFLVLAVAVAANLHRVRDDLPWYACYAINIQMAIEGHADNRDWGLAHFWTLAVEEQFYLAWPLVLLLVRPKYLPLVCGAALLAAPALRFVLYRAGAEVSAVVLPVSCLDGFAAGALLAVCRPHGAAVARVSLVAGLGAASLGAAFWFLGVGWAVRGALLPLGFALVSAWAVGRASVGFGGPVGRALGSRPLVWLGTISYGIYVIHFAIRTSFESLGLGDIPRTDRPGGWSWALFAYLLSASVALAAVSWYCFESPINNLKRYFPYVPVARRPPVAAGHPAAG